MKCVVCDHYYDKICKFCSKRKHCEPCVKQDCKFCFEHTLASVSRIVDEWSSENKVNPRNVWKTSSKQYKLECSKCNRQYFQRAIHMQKHGCSMCNNKTEVKLFHFLKANYDVKTQVKFSWSGKFSFDFQIENILIEVDGPQHFRPIAGWKSGWQHIENDLIKEEHAVQNSFFVLRVLQKDIFEDKNDWQTYLTTEINNIFAKKYENCQVITSSSAEYMQGVYKRFRSNASFF